MNKEGKYFYVTSTSSGWPVRYIQELVKWNPNFEVEIDEEVESHQNITLYINRLDQKDISQPNSSESKKVKSIIKETFFDHYLLALKYIHESNTEEGEFYLLSKSKDWFIVRYYSKNEKQKQSIEIDFRNGIESLWLRVSANKGHKHRPDSRKNGTALDHGRFRQFLNLTIQFLHDPDSYLIFIDDYIKNFLLVADGKERINSFINKTERSFENVLTQLTIRKETLEKRLIENDTDTSLDRAKLRGELDGLQYAIMTITKNC